MEKYYLCRRININDKIIRDLKDLMDLKLQLSFQSLKSLIKNKRP